MRRVVKHRWPTRLAEHGMSVISTVTNQGKARWMIIDENFNADKLIEFLPAHFKDEKKKVFLILGNLRVITASR